MVVCFFLAICACSLLKSKEFMPGIDVPIDEMNNEIVLVDDPALGNSHKNLEILTVIVTNKSDSTVVFPADYNGLLYSKTDGWKSIENRTYYPDEDVNLLPSTQNPDGELYVTLPIMENIDVPTPIRIVVVGFIKGHPEKKVGAYIDLVLQP
jgi:hypothetical protein